MFTAGVALAPLGADATTTDPAFRFATDAGAAFVPLVAVFFAATPRLAGAVAFLEVLAATDFVDFFAAALKFSGVVASIPMTLR